MNMNTYQQQSTQNMISEMLSTGHITDKEVTEWEKLGDKHVKVLYHAFYKLINQ